MNNCISCDKSLDINTSIVYNSLYYCKSCYDDMLKIFMNYQNENEKTRQQIYCPPVKIIDNIYIGNIDSVDYDKLTELEISNIIICGKNLKNNIHNKFEYIEFLIDDSFEQNIIEHIRISNKYIDKNKDKKILIHCYSGISRSSSFVIGYLMYKLKLNFNDAYKYIKNIYPKAIPNEYFMEQLIYFV